MKICDLFWSIVESVSVLVTSENFWYNWMVWFDGLLKLPFENYIFCFECFWICHFLCFGDCMIFCCSQIWNWGYMISLKLICEKAHVCGLTFLGIKIHVCVALTWPHTYNLTFDIFDWMNDWCYRWVTLSAVLLQLCIFPTSCLRVLNDWKFCLD